MTNPADVNAGMNPFLPFGIYVPDGEPKVFGDRVWLYGSYDRFNGGYCSKEYHSFSAPLSDLTQWTEHGVSFTTDDVPWSDADLYAPDALFHNGMYYLFFCLSDGSEGVAESPCPEGPFHNAKRITLEGEPITGIDPSVLEDGGRVYYTWGQFELCMGELSDEMCSLKPATVRRGVITNHDGAQGFHEGSSLRRLGDRYCLIYASEYAAESPNRGARPTKLDYAVSASPYGPYERCGTVIDNTGCDPASWNNHGSVIKIGSEWFVFYHASSNNSAFSRRARVERLRVDEANAVIEQAFPTSNGFRAVLYPQHIVSPVNACRLFGGAYLTEKNGGFPAVNLGGAGFAFSPAAFDGGAYVLTVDCLVNEKTTLRFFLGEETAAEAALLPKKERQTVAVPFEAPQAALPLRFVFDGSREDSCEVYGMTIELRNKN